MHQITQNDNAELWTECHSLYVLSEIDIGHEGICHRHNSTKDSTIRVYATTANGGLNKR